MDYVNAFICGGILCAIGQLLIDLTNWTPARILTGYVVAGVVLQAVGVYQSVVDWGGAGCSASVLSGHLLRGMQEGKWERIVFAPTGALLSPTSSFQGESIPSICHAVVFENQPAQE